MFLFYKMNNSIKYFIVWNKVVNGEIEMCIWLIIN